MGSALQGQAPSSELDATGGGPRAVQGPGGTGHPRPGRPEPRETLVRTWCPTPLSWTSYGC